VRLGNFSSVLKSYLISPPEAKKRRYRYVIYKQIDAIYYGDKDDENCVLEKVEWTAKEEM
jgi:hypothetical protein